jgi:CHAD domain-containing protein
MPVTEVTETERKFEVDVELEVPDLATVAGVAEVHREDPVTLRAVYFDTARGALAGAGFTLRRREGGHDAGWHLKTPSPLGRTEHRVALTPVGSGERGGTQPPRELLDLVTAWSRRDPLKEVARITTERTATVVFTRTAGSAPAAEIADDRVSATDLRTGVLRLWREWEVELLAPADVSAPNAAGSNTSATDAADSITGASSTSTSATLLRSIEEALVAAGATPSRAHSKLARALGRVDLAPDSPSTPKDTTTALGAVIAVLSSLRDALLAADPGVRAQKDDAVHQMRIVVRRLRGALAAFRGILDPAALDALRERLSTLGNTLGVVRDAEVRHNRAAALVANAQTHGDTDLRASAGTPSVTYLPATAGIPSDTRVPAATPLRHRLVEDTRAEYETLLAGLLDYLGAEEYFALLDDIDGLIARPPVTATSLDDSRTSLRRVLRQESRRARRRLKRADRSDLGGLHGARKAARRLRYVAEALSEGDSPVLGGKARALAESAEAVQDVLGEHRDATLFAERLERTAQQATEAGEDASDYAALIAEEREHARSAADALEPAARDLRRAAKA